MDNGQRISLPEYVLATNGHCTFVVMLRFQLAGINYNNYQLLYRLISISVFFCVFRPNISRQRPGTHSRLQRPKSVPTSSLHLSRTLVRGCETPSHVRQGRFDTLSPFVISDLLRKSESVGTSGSETDSIPEEKSPLIELLQEETRQLAETGRDDDASTTSGIDSAASDNEIVSSETDSDFEPVIIADVNIPELNLRPEKLDAIYVPEPKRGWRQFDFDMSNIELPAYLFKSPFPDYLVDIDLKQMAKQKWNWRHHLKQRTGPRPSDLEGVLDRLVELEKLQMDTVAWEQKRSIQLRKSASRKSGSAKLKDRRCCSQCLQATCCGDCPEKLVQSNTCEFCRQSFCTGTCKEVTYDQRMRQARVEDERPITPKVHFPRACSTCQKKNASKFINANNLILGQPRFNNTTFSRGQFAYKVKDLRPKAETSFSQDIVSEFEKLGIEPTQPRPNTAMPITNRPKSRNSLYPGKSFNSQRKSSLTETDKASALKKRRSRSAKTIRPKTAA